MVGLCDNKQRVSLKHTQPQFEPTVPQRDTTWQVAFVPEKHSCSANSSCRGTLRPKASGVKVWGRQWCVVPLAQQGAKRNSRRDVNAGQAQKGKNPVFERELTPLVLPGHHCPCSALGITPVCAGKHWWAAS